MKPSSPLLSSILVLSLASAACSIAVHNHPAPAAVPPPSTEANIARVTTTVLGRSQFAHHPLDTELAGKFLAGYLDALDGGRSLFLQSDVTEFAKFQSTLAQVMRDRGDTSAARVILNRYVERLRERQAYVADLLKLNHFDFSGHDSYTLDREHASRPIDVTSARALWREQLRAEYLQEKLAGTAPAKIVQRLNNRYAQQLAMTAALKPDEVLDIYLNALAHVYDPHSDYLGHEEMESLSIAMNLSLVGIGATLESDEGYCEIRSLVPGGPAERAGLLNPGDRIVAVAQAGQEPVNIISMPLSRAVELIRGKKGTQVTLSILPRGAADGSVPKRVQLVRDEVQLEDEQASARIVDLPTGKGKLRLGVLDLPSFYADLGDSAGPHRSVTADVSRLLAKLNAEKIQGLIIDLRRNGGGSLNEAVSLTGLFIPEGPVVQTRGPTGEVEVDRDTDPREQYDGPLVVLASRFSASASEILTGALKDYGRALIVGDSSTFGKGTVQSILPLASIMDQAGVSYSYDPGALKVTIRKFYRPDGASTQLRGVASDIVLPSTSDVSEVSESAMKDPLPWDAVARVPHEQMNAVAPYLDALRDDSAARVKAAPGFALLAEDVAQVKKNLASKTVSLNEAERRTELAAAKTREQQRNALSKALTPEPKSYLITLKNADLPGLPPASAFDGNVVARQPKPAPPKDSEPDSDGDGPDKADSVILDETVQILRDYTALLARGVASIRLPGAAVRH